MRCLPCRPAAPQQGCADGNAKSRGKPYLASSWPGQPGHPLSYKCSGCGRLTTITAQQFARLPVLR